MNSKIIWSWILLAVVAVVAILVAYGMITQPAEKQARNSCIAHWTSEGYSKDFAESICD